jgi:hypothetical protein
VRSLTSTPGSLGRTPRAWRPRSGGAVSSGCWPNERSTPRNGRYVSQIVEALDAALKTDAVSRHGGVLWLSPSG